MVSSACMRDWVASIIINSRCIVSSHTMKVQTTTLIACLIMILNVPATLSLDEEAAKEGPCFETPTYAGIDWDWLRSVKTWYFPIWSRLELYRGSSDLLNMKIEDIPESILPHACITASGDTFVTSGFNTSVALKIEYTKAMRIWFFANENPYAKAATHTILYSDNRNYVIGLTCHEDAQIGWAIWTVEPNLSKELETEGIQVLKKAGLNMDFLVRLEYGDRCNPQSSGQQNQKAVEL